MNKGGNMYIKTNGPICRGTLFYDLKIYEKHTISKDISEREIHRIDALLKNWQDLHWTNHV